MPRFKKGNALGTGRPPGSRNKSTLVLDELGREGIEEVIRKVAEAARDGNMRAASILLARAWPRGRGRAVTLDLPPVETAGAIVQAHAAVVAQMAAGELTPDEASTVGDVLETQRRAIETHDHEKRIRGLEASKKEGPGPEGFRMTIASHGRRLDALAPTGRPRTLGELLEDSDEEKAVKAICAFARALVAAVPPQQISGGNRREPAYQAARREPAPPAPRKPERLDPRQEVTFEEAMKQPWIGIEPIKPSVPPSEQPPQLPRPKGWIDPWGGGGFLLPSYARDEEE